VPRQDSRRFGRRVAQRTRPTARLSRAATRRKAEDLPKQIPWRPFPRPCNTAAQPKRRLRRSCR